MKKKLLSLHISDVCKQILSDWFFWIIFLLYSACMFYLFYKQCGLNEDYSFYSDMALYIDYISGREIPFAFPYPLFFGTASLLTNFMPVEIAISIVLTFLNSMGVIFVRNYFIKQLEETTCQNKKYNFVITFATFAIFLMSMVFFANSGLNDRGYGVSYLGVFSPNSYHNATSIATRPFAILMVFQFVEIMKKGFSDVKIKDYSLFSLYCLLSVLAKPSFVLISLPVFGIIVVISVIKERFTNWKFMFAMGLAVLPTIIALVIQYVIVFLNEEGDGISIAPGVAWHIWSSNIWVSIIKANLFGIVVLICNIKELKRNLLYLYCWCIYFAGLGTFYILCENGYRISHANFAWGYMNGLFFVNLGSIMMLFRKWFVLKEGFKWYDILAVLALLAHLVCGISFFIYTLNGGASSYF